MPVAQATENTVRVAGDGFAVSPQLLMTLPLCFVAELKSWRVSFFFVLFCNVWLVVCTEEGIFGLDGARNIIIV
jgi:hypothetical protein